MAARKLPAHALATCPAPRNYLRIGYRIIAGQLQGTVESAYRSDGKQLLTALLWCGRVDPYSLQVLTEALGAIVDEGRPVRFHAFAAAAGELFLHASRKIASRMKRRWRLSGTAGGEELSDTFEMALGVGVDSLHEEIIAAMEQLNHVTHLRPRSITTESPEADRIIQESLSALQALFASVGSFLEQILRLLEPPMSPDALHALILETRCESGDLVACNWAGDAFVEKLTVTELCDQSAALMIEVSLDVIGPSGFGFDSVD